tara:strand:- start:1021 stop:1290 length:270 start_codon:yes stop_codon:yes gene_type:complete
MWGECQEVLVVSVDYFLLLWIGLVLVDDLGSVDIPRHILYFGLVDVFGFILGFVNVFGDIDTLFNDGGFFYMAYLESTAREKNSSDKSN